MSIARDEVPDLWKLTYSSATTRDNADKVPGAAVTVVKNGRPLLYILKEEDDGVSLTRREFANTELKNIFGLPEKPIIPCISKIMLNITHAYVINPDRSFQVLGFVAGGHRTAALNENYLLGAGEIYMRCKNEGSPNEVITKKGIKIFDESKVRFDVSSYNFKSGGYFKKLDEFGTGVEAYKEFMKYLEHSFILREQAGLPLNKFLPSSDEVPVLREIASLVNQGDIPSSPYTVAISHSLKRFDTLSEEREKLAADEIATATLAAKLQNPSSYPTQEASVATVVASTVASSVLATAEKPEQPITMKKGN